MDSLDRIGKVLMCLGCHIHGQYVSVYVLAGEPVDRIRCTVPRASFNFVKATLELDFNVTPVAGLEHAFLIGPERVLVEMRMYSPQPWNSPQPWGSADGATDFRRAFDIDALSISKRNMYAASTPFMGTLLDRIRRRVFALASLPEGRDDEAVVDAATIMKDAFGLVKRGWTMERREGAGWTVSNFGGLRARRDSKFSELSSSHVCPICCDKIADRSIAVELACGHVFHVFCGPAGRGGLHEWLTIGKDCPCCRSRILS